MKQVAQNYRTGELTVLDVPPPVCRPGGVLVRSRYSLISTGTEMMKVNEASLSLVGKARARPEHVRTLLDSVAQQGLRTTYTKAMHQLDAYTPLGYSSCGTVAEVGEGVEELRLGQLVACAGNEFALHAEVNWVPRQLCVPVPEGADPRFAAFATVGAIALQGVRRCELQLGEAACVVGLGLVGQIVVQLLATAGVRVVGLDVVPERCRLAEKAGAVACAVPDADGLGRIEHVLAELTGGFGADGILLVAGGSSRGPVEAAARLARDRARVVDIGKLNLDLPWNAYYEKELELRFSRSYGPGRYDERYELAGIDYPVGYVRWTEQRNIECFLDLVARGELALDLLASEPFPVDAAGDVYERLRTGQPGSIGVLFEYADTGPAGPPAPGAGVLEEEDGACPAPRVEPGPAPAGSAGRSGSDIVGSSLPQPVRRRARPGGRVRVGFVGAGSYASTVLLPLLARCDDVELAAVATATSLSAANAQRRFGFTRAVTGAAALLEADDLDALFVVTRHHSHADLVCRSLESGKATFVEKPLALTDEELARVRETVRTTGNDRLMVGFNRRFAPLLVDLRRRFGTPAEAAVVHYLVNAGPLPATSWYRNEELEGARFSGEGGHFLDAIGWWLGANPVAVHALRAGMRDDLHVTVRYDDGSVAGIDYVTHGNPRHPKETIEASAAGRSARFENFRRATLWHGRRRTRIRAWGAPDKGQGRQLACFLDAVRDGAPMPIPLDALVATTSATLAVTRSLRAGGAVTL